MKSTPELEAEIVRLHYAEHWTVGTIATQLETHVEVVERVLGLGEPRAPSELRPRIIDPYRPFIDDTLRRYPKLLATRLYDMVRERGFPGSVRTVREHVALVLKGGSGLGKTMIAQNFAQAALVAGFTVRFSTLAAALADLLGQESLPAFERRLRRYTHPDLLVLDELGYLPCDSRAADILYNIISRRHEQRSTIITTNLAFKQWGTTFPGAACVVALVDRFAQHCHRLEILGESWRDKHRLDTDRPDPTPSRSRRKRS
jgi:hypothetical protein